MISTVYVYSNPPSERMFYRTFHSLSNAFVSGFILFFVLFIIADNIMQHTYCAVDIYIDSLFSASLAKKKMRYNNNNKKCNTKQQQQQKALTCAAADTEEGETFCTLYRNGQTEWLLRIWTDLWVQKLLKRSIIQELLYIFLACLATWIFAIWKDAVLLKRFYA